MMKDFLEGLEANAERIITEAAPITEAAEGGKTFSELASGAKWGYIPKPKDGKGFGSAKNTLLFIKENNPDSWDIYVMKSAAGEKVGGAADKAAAMGVRKRPVTEPGVNKESKEMGRLIALTEDVLSGKTLNEAAGNVEGDTALLNNDTWKSTKVLSGLKFADLLEKCVAVVSPKAGGGKSFLN